MNDFGLISAFLIGIAGSVHCVGMCGGIVGALSFSMPKQVSHFPYHLAYNIGRIISYTIAGAISGSVGAIFSHQIKNGIAILSVLSGLFLLLLASYIGNWWRLLSSLEALGGHFWKKLVPISKRLLPLRSPYLALPYGMIWGWLPCGLVYSTLSWAMASGNTWDGASIMLFFGLGTLPALLALGSSGNQIRMVLSSPITRQLIAMLLLIFGIFILFSSLTPLL